MNWSAPESAHPDMTMPGLNLGAHSCAAATLKTPTAILQELREHGMTVRQLAESKGLDRQDVADLLYLRNKGLRGKAHAAAIAIGLKPQPKTLRTKELA